MIQRDFEKNNCDVAIAERGCLYCQRQNCVKTRKVRCDFVAGMIVGGLRRNNMSTDITKRESRDVGTDFTKKLQLPSIKLGELIS